MRNARHIGGGGIFFVIPAEAGTQSFHLPDIRIPEALGPRLRGDDEKERKETTP
jgi:hypothetical protein